MAYVGGSASLAGMFRKITHFGDRRHRYTGQFIEK